MEKLAQYLGGGKVYKYTKSAVHLSIVDLSLITEKIIPLFEKKSFSWCKISGLSGLM